MQERVNPLCIVADDSIFLTLLVAHLSRTSHVISMFPGLRDKGARYLQAVADANGFSMDRVEVLEKRKPYLTLDDTHQKKVIPLIQLGDLYDMFLKYYPLFFSPHIGIKQLVSDPKIKFCEPSGHM